MDQGDNHRGDFREDAEVSSRNRALSHIHSVDVVLPILNELIFRRIPDSLIHKGAECLPGQGSEGMLGRFFSFRGVEGVVLKNGKANRFGIGVDLVAVDFTRNEERRVVEP